MKRVGTISIGRRASAWAGLGLAAYLTVILVSPVLHHDFACHQNSPAHCAACIATQVADHTGDHAAGLAWTLRDVGRVVRPVRPIVAPLVLAARAGRAPPSLLS
ncbi:MAG: hypothetical protein WCP29_11885 [Acidobacteriota bacterium]